MEDAVDAEVVAVGHLSPTHKNATLETPGSVITLRGPFCLAVAGTLLYDWLTWLMLVVRTRPDSAVRLRGVLRSEGSRV